MKKKIFVTICLLICGVSVFAEHLLGFNFGTGYRNNNFEYEDFTHNVGYWTNFMGFTYTFYPSYTSPLGFSLYTNFLGLDVPISRDISDTGRNSNYHYVENYNYPDDAHSEHLRYSLSIDTALNFRFPVKDFDKSFTYLRLGGNYQLSTFDMRMERNNDAPGNLSYEKDVDGIQNSFGAFAEIGRNYGKGEVSLKFVYDFLLKSELTNNEYIKPNSFGIVFSCRPKTWRIESKKDKAYMQKILHSEDVYSKDKYKLYDTKRITLGNVAYFAEFVSDSNIDFKEDFFDTPLSLEYYRRFYETIDYDYWVENAKPFAREIFFTMHELSNAKPGTDEYISVKTKEVKLPFYADADKKAAFNALVEDYNRMQELERRKAENESIAQDKADELYKKALSTKSLSEVIKYINENRGHRYFHEEAYAEVAKLVTGNKNVSLTDLPYISNPYSLEKGSLYYAPDISVYQWTGNGSFLAKISEDEYPYKLIFIRNVYDVSKIGEYIQNAYLRYRGTYEYNSTYAGVQVVAEFDLVYSFNYYFYEER